ncbi:MAG: nitrite/sulfite reductase [Deltaproteobacteria bacterium]|nr:nitrite/sulfite reductase [Deltaproteobacteria bacterium]
MQRKLRFDVRSAEEDLKAAGLVLDFDEIARRGSMSSDEVFVAKWYGIYNMRQPGTHMARVVVPGGVLTSSQARALARVSEEYGQGKLSITTRQSIQLHWLKCARLPDFLRDLRKAGLTTFHGCGDVNRNVVACPWASYCRHRRFDVMPNVMEAYRAFVTDRELDNLPRKFKLSFSGCGAGCSQPYMNDVGLVAVTRESGNGAVEEGFRVVVGGGHGWKAFGGKGAVLVRAARPGYGGMQGGSTPFPRSRGQVGPFHVASEVRGAPQGD